MSDDKYIEMAKLVGPIAGLTDAQVPGLAHIFRNLARAERRGAYKRVKDSVLSMRVGWQGRAAGAAQRNSDKDQLLHDTQVSVAETICEEIDCYIEDGK